jgi:hypothetical protein
MQRVQMGLPHDEQEILVSVSGWFTQVRTISATSPAYCPAAEYPARAPAFVQTSPLTNPRTDEQHHDLE